ncbi:ABC transporter substrate-binding protein [Paenibacillus sp. MMS20-IR301]|uniref:ABC transporter substrate-binding protein n=1 Tax=Paenibacillus sp. MMS20-IR301 TaxID=2895946 RepID=UPI0028E18987|nr:ABC transporter substrate-binding protein [Paenibacillus sp. MMS20-IR301]WNS44115.1 ABC transporter substrate-binding protein [Paenibacillus sp. MMS20-IR301]
MSRTKLPLIAVLCLVIIMAGVLSACQQKENGGNAAEGAGQETVSLVMTMPTFSTIPKEITKVQEAMNEISRKEIGVEVELQIIDSAAYNQQMILMLASGEKLDIMSGLFTYSSAYQKGQLTELDGLLEEHGQGIIKALGEEYINATRINGVLYGLPNLRDFASGYGAFSMRKDILDKYKIDIATIKTIEDVGNVFKIVHENEPNLTTVAPSAESFLNQYRNFDGLGNDFGVLLNYGEKLEVVNLFKSEDYKNYLKLVRGWYQNGYISKDVTTTTEAVTPRVKAGSLFAYNTTWKPGIEQQESNMAGTPMFIVQTLDSFMPGSSVSSMPWTIPINSEHPDKAMEYLNLLYTNEDMMNLLAYGIEGDHYVDKTGGTIGFPDGIDSKNSGYNLNMTWLLPNEFITKVWEGNQPSIWEDTRKFNETAKKSAALGFTFDNAKVATEITSVQNVYDEYRKVLENGVVDPDEYLPEMNAKLDAAGIDVIIEEKQRQLDEWASKK